MLRITHLTWRIIICWLVAVCLFSPVAFAQSPADANVDFFVKSPPAGQPLTVGDRVTLRLEVSHPRASRVNLPQLNPEWQQFMVVDQSAPQEADNGDGTVSTGKDIVVTLFEPGQYQTPALTVTQQKADGAVEELVAPVISLEVTSVLTEDKELRDLKPQIDLPVPPLWPWILLGVWLALVLVVALWLLGLWLYRRWPRRLANQPDAPTFVDPRPPEEIAHAELKRIESLNLPAQQRFKEHYSLIADCLRRYIEGRYQIPALEETTDEVQTAFKKAKVARREISAFISLFIESDLVKFARYAPQPDEVDGLINRARVIVDATTPEPDATPPPEVTA